MCHFEEVSQERQNSLLSFRQSPEPKIGTTRNLKSEMRFKKISHYVRNDKKIISSSFPQIYSSNTI